MTVNDRQEPVEADADFSLRPSEECIREIEDMERQNAVNVHALLRSNFLMD